MAAMNDPTRVSFTHFCKEVGRYQDLALTRAVIVTRNGRDRTVMISANEYSRLQRKSGRTLAPRFDTDIEPIARNPVAAVDATTLHAAAAFLGRIRQSHASAQAILFGSRARGTHTPDSDADIAVILKGKPKDRFLALEPMSDAAYDILMETGIYIQPLALWEAELNRPALFGNPALIDNIKRDSVWL